MPTIYTIKDRLTTNEQLKEARREAQRLELLKRELAKPTAERVRQLLK